MSAVVSTSTGRSYGGKRVCSAWGVNVTRSTFYAAPPEAEPARRGPAPQVCDEELHAMIVDDLERSPFIAVHRRGTPHGVGASPSRWRARVAQTRTAPHARAQLAVSASCAPR